MRTMTETDTREVDMHEVEFDPETFPEPRPIGPNVMRLGEPGRS